ncbi:MAG: Mur ligase family protein, partial [Paracoccaceae bacterium]
AALARPHVAIVTTVAPAHMAAFDSLDAIAREKAAIFAGLEPGGVAIVNADLAASPLLADVAARYGARIIRFGAQTGADHPNPDFWLARVQLARDVTVAEARHGDARLIFKLNTAGRHFALNALAALAAVDAVGGDVGLALSDLSRWSPPAGRGTRETLVMDLVDDHLRFDLIDDAFNANPASLQAALDVLAAAVPQNGLGRVTRGRRIAILGDMLELGSAEAELHAAIADYPAIGVVDLVCCVGPRMQALHDALPETRRGGWYASADLLARRVEALIDAGDVVLVKGSKGSQVSRVVDAIRELGHPLSDDAQGID